MQSVECIVVQCASVWCVQCVQCVQCVVCVVCAECRVQSAQCRVQSAECRVQSAEVQSAECSGAGAGAGVVSVWCRCVRFVLFPMKLVVCCDDGLARLSHSGPSSL